ncbi:hypothetical protein BS78_10G005600 [Paspalum vaginatum]|nr:hypothetical protein BS78_10G005600 [Paspalum vaginatum]
MAHQLTLALLERESSSISRSSSSWSDDDDNDRRRRDQAPAAMAAGGRRERMFEKVVTPSDVGKLNRLVVPKHFAEKHLPLPGAAARAGGTVLCFHDARGGGGAPSCWRFRYSYWGSSQSYVMTKGWSRYVRDKRLAAGDTVSFCRDGARLFIDCRRRRRTPVPSSLSVVLAAAPMMPQAQQQLVQKQHSLVVAAPRVVVADDAAVAAMQAQEARGRRCLRLFGVNLLLELQNAAEPLLLDLQL